MRRIFEGEVYDIVAQPGGIVFSYCEEKSDDQILVSYKMFSLENNKMTDVAKNIYQLSKFGSNYRAITEEFENHVTVRSVILPNGKVFTVDRFGKANLFGTEGEHLFGGVMLYRNNPPSDISFHNNSLWCAYSESNSIVRYNIINLRPEIRIGGKVSPFFKPSDIFVTDDSAIISNPASNKLVKLNFNNFEAHTYKEFTEPVYAYKGVKDTEFLLMESGIYIM